jgi:hypothetical protein
LQQAVRPPNDEVIARLVYVTEVGTPDQKAAAQARILMLRDAFKADREYPSTMPVLPMVETEIWNWWHKLNNQSQAQNELRGSVSFAQSF